MNETCHATSEMIIAAKGGDMPAFEQLVVQFEPMLMAFAAYRIADREEAREAVQDTFIRAHEQLNTFRDGADFGTWLRAICRFMVLTRVNNVIRERAHKDDYKSQIDVLVLQQCRDGGSELTYDVLPLLQACLEKLESRSRQLVSDRYSAGMSSKEIAEKRGRTVTWVTSTLSRVRKALRICIEKETKEETP